MSLGSRAVLCIRLTPADTEVGPSFAKFWILTPETQNLFDYETCSNQLLSCGRNL